MIRGRLAGWRVGDLGFPRPGWVHGIGGFGVVWAVWVVWVDGFGDLVIRGLWTCGSTVRRFGGWGEWFGGHGDVWWYEVEVVGSGRVDGGVAAFGRLKVVEWSICWSVG